MTPNWFMPLSVDDRRRRLTVSRVAWLWPMIAVTLVASGLAAVRADAVCVGDCEGDGRVSIANVQACVNLGANLPAPSCAAADQNNDGIVDANEVDLCLQSFLDATNCPMVFTPASTPTRTNTTGPPPTNTPVPTNTTAPTSTNTPVPTAPPVSATPTPTPTIHELTCNLKANPSSQIQIHIAALPVPLTFGLSGSIAIGASAPDASQNSSAVCDVVQLAPVSIPSIGFVCISPASGCPVGKRDCDGGTPLGIDVPSDGNAGACSSNAQCQSICETKCGGTDHVLTAQCTGFCTAGDQSACTSDAQCATAPKGGACNGPDPVGESKNICQCTCLDTAAHGASNPGDLQCNLGSSLVVETGAPCNGTDVLINVGTTCIPVTTQRASSLISNSNFTSDTVPAPPNMNDLTGAAVSCATLDGGSLTGVSGVGAVNFFGSALGDLAVGLKATCQ